MSDPAKPNPFSFGNPTSGTSGSLFGQTNSSAPTPAGGLFGSSANTPASSTASPFGNTGTAGGSSFFGGGVSSGGPNKPTGGWTFGEKQGGNTSGGGLFGAVQPPKDVPSSGTASSGFTGFSTPSKPSESTTTAPSQTPGLLSGAGSTGAFSLGNLGMNTSTGQATTTTPTSKPTTSLFGNSTTPAGPPPSTNGGASVLFGSKPSQETNAPFASLGNRSLAPGNTSTAAPSSGSNVFSFAASKPKELPSATSTAQSPSIFGSTPSTGASNLFGNKRPAQPDGGNLFNMNKGQDTGATKSDTSQQSQPEAPKTSSLFSNLSGQPSAAASTAQTSATQSAFSFLKPSQPQSSTTDPVSSSTAAPSAFGFFSSPPKSVGASAPSSNAPSNSLFSNLGQPQDKAPVTKSETTSTSAASTSAPATASSLFGNFAKPSAQTNTSQPPTQPAATSTAEGSGTANANANLGASTAGPPPPAQSRLKNKSMDDIITRWASDLSKYQKEFQKQADKVATWDRMLVENSEKIQKLYGSTLEAERATTEVERQLSAVESDQETLESWLDYYEKEVDSMIAGQQGGQGETISAPDQEREKTYQIASKLSERLDEMGKDLSTMIEEINDASSTLSRTGRADDPLTQVVRVLNSHLTQLQQIDQGATALQLKVQEAQRAGQSFGPLSGPISDAADGFYRSYMGRR